MEVKTPLLLRVRLAFGTYSVGYVFKSPPLPATLRQDWINRGLLEVVKDEKEEASPVGPKANRGKKFQ